MSIVTYLQKNKFLEYKVTLALKAHSLKCFVGRLFKIAINNKQHPVNKKCLKINTMEPILRENHLEKISQFDNAVFYCINGSSRKIPVGIVRNFSLSGDNRLEFSLTNFPVLEYSWNVFAAELHFYKKGLPFNITLHGTAWFVDQNELTVQFKILHTECFGRPEEKSYSLQNSLIGFISNTGVFFKKMLATGF